MPIPQEILSVKRPKNTIVIAYGKDKNLYAVRQRIGCKNINGRHIPVNGPTIGHIIDGKYVAIEEDVAPAVSTSDIELKEWAGVVQCNNVFQDILSDLKKFYASADALKIYCIAVLRVCNPGIKDCELKDAYLSLIHI